MNTGSVTAKIKRLYSRGYGYGRRGVAHTLLPCYDEAFLRGWSAGDWRRDPRKATFRAVTDANRRHPVKPRGQALGGALASLP